LSNLQDQFMGKLLGLPMGMAPCYTLHSNITLEGQQMATQLLTSAGAVYYMDVALNTDRMLAYFDTSAHDDQSLREIFNLRPAPEYLAWAIERGIFSRNESGAPVRGEQWGNPAQFCASKLEFQELLAATPAAYGFENAGPRPNNQTSRTTRLNQAVARDAIRKELQIEELLKVADFRIIETRATSKESHLHSPDLGSNLADESAGKIVSERNQVQLLVSDGLSAEAIHRNVPALLPVLLEGLSRRGVRCGKPMVARYGRVKLAEDVANRLEAELMVYLIGERPGGDAAAASSMSAYFVYRLGDPATRQTAADFSGNSSIAFEYSVISNIYDGGLPPAEAAAMIVEKISEILTHRAAGNRLENLIAKCD
jgi:ethanolamine ammonia-lyase large subunit